MNFCLGLLSEEGPEYFIDSSLGIVLVFHIPLTNRPYSDFSDKNVEG